MTLAPVQLRLFLLAWVFLPAGRLGAGLQWRTASRLLSKSKAAQISLARHKLHLAHQVACHSQCKATCPQDIRCRKVTAHPGIIRDTIPTQLTGSRWVQDTVSPCRDTECLHRVRCLSNRSHRSVASIARAS